MRCSPPVRMNRSGSGAPASCSSVREQGFVDRCRLDLAGDGPRRQLARGLDDVPAAAVRDGDVQRHAVVGRRARLGGGDLRIESRAQAARVADEAHADAVAVQFVDLLVDRLDEQLHQPRHFVGRALPVLAREREERQRLDAAPRAAFDGRAHGLDARAVAEVARQRAALGPAPVAIHDDGDVAWEAGRARLRLAARLRPASVPFPSRAGPRRPRRRTCP